MNPRMCSLDWNCLCLFTWKLSTFQQNEHAPGWYPIVIFLKPHEWTTFCSQRVKAIQWRPHADMPETIIRLPDWKSYGHIMKTNRQGCARFAEIWSELTKTWSSGATGFWVWIGNCNVKVWKSTEDKLHKIWNSNFFCQNSGKPAHPRVHECMKCMPFWLIRKSVVKWLSIRYVCP